MGVTGFGIKKVVRRVILVAALPFIIPRLLRVLSLMICTYGAVITCAQGDSQPLSGACGSKTIYQPGQSLPTPTSWTPPATGQIQPTPPATADFIPSFHAMVPLGTEHFFFEPPQPTAALACGQILNSLVEVGYASAYIVPGITLTAGTIYNAPSFVQYMNPITVTLAECHALWQGQDYQFGLLGLVEINAVCPTGYSGGYNNYVLPTDHCSLTNPTKVMKPSDGICNVVVNNKGIEDADPQDPDCTTSTNACIATAKASRLLNSGRCCAREGNPINPGSGVKHEQISLYRGIYPSPLNVEMQFLQTPSTAFTVPNFTWRTPFQGNVQILTENGYTYGLVVLPPYSSNQFSYFHKVGTAWVGDLGSKVTLTEVKNAGGILTGFQAVDANDTAYDFTLSASYTTLTLAYLSTITTRDGKTITIGRPATGPITMSDQFGHTIAFTTNAAGIISTMTTPDSTTTLNWDTAGTKLLSIQWPDSKTRSFLYENATWPNALTGIVDENNNRYATWTYDTEGNATGSWHGGTLNAEKVTLAYNANGTTTATDPLGGNRTYQFAMINGIIKASGLSQPCTNCGTHFAAATYDLNGNVSALCGALHKADYVDRSIMWS